MNNRFIVVDLETTGNKVGKDKIIQIGAILIENGEIIERLSSFVNPNQKLSPFIKQLTGINDQILEKAPPFSLVAPLLLEMMQGSYFVAHNVPFDITFLEEELLANGFKPRRSLKIDTVELSRILLPTSSSYKLNHLAREYKIEHDQPHRADSDAEVTAELLLLLLNKLQKLPVSTLHKLESSMGKLQSDFKPLLEDILEKKLGVIEEEENSIEVYRDIALKRNIPTTISGDSFESFLHLQPLDSLQFLKNTLPQFENRTGQIEMINSVEKAFHNHYHGLIEAGTGTGKTLGYLIPALFSAKKTRRPVVISTYTTQLQEQILSQEVHYLKKALPFTFRATIIKGRYHYLCLRKFEQYFGDETSDNYDTSLTKSQILVWLTETTEGDVDELNLSSGGSIFWKKVSSDANTCFNHKCPWYTRCFYQRKKQETEKSDIIISNHALLFSDIKNDFSVLPPHSEVIIDEAHHIEDSISEQFGTQLDYFNIVTILNRLGGSDGTELASKAKTIIDQIGLNEYDHLKECDELFSEVKITVDDLFRNIRAYLLTKNDIQKNEIGRMSYRYDTMKETGALWKDIKNNAFVAINKLEDLASAVAGLVDCLGKVKDQMTYNEKGIFSDFQSLILALNNIGDQLCNLLFESNTNKVTWIETEPKGALNATFLYSQPIDCSSILADKFFASKQSVILTSATLAIKNSFEYIQLTLGLDEFEVLTKIIPSPFSYKDQVKLMIPNDIPQIKDINQEEFIEEISRRIIQIAKVTKGRMLILFTSYDMLEKTYNYVKAENDKEMYALIAQGISSGSRAKLTKNFKQYDNAILFGTSSFWEGIDIPGEDLSCIVIARLPFSPPTHPIMAAKSDWLKQEGKNSFMQLYLPQAIIRFKQGFGRLVRSQNDRGVVVVLDQRILAKSYGKKFITALPPVETMVESTDSLINEISDWL
ncbi:ATP-dependent DNA helicase DinG [Bacillus sp. Marseille-P3661]|uniref:ATP-dependent DNA helicase DinG n=1 Tax=Bacillus sp. Marseille-P3661 TaxID=1936234 RepID=UPI000C837390|nr:ATP-dependent DNA helicase DinG [Bacillus sp. Marseille-P3661]